MHGGLLQQVLAAGALLQYLMHGGLLLQVLAIDGCDVVVLQFVLRSLQELCVLVQHSCVLALQRERLLQTRLTVRALDRNARRFESTCTCTRTCMYM